MSVKIASGQDDTFDDFLKHYFSDIVSFELKNIIAFLTVSNFSCLENLPSRQEFLFPLFVSLMHFFTNNKVPIEYRDVFNLNLFKEISVIFIDKELGFAVQKYAEEKKVGLACEECFLEKELPSHFIKGERLM